MPMNAATAQATLSAASSSSSPSALDIIIMAAGKGTRMKSRTPKVLQRLAGRPLLWHVLDQAASLQARRVVVVTCLLYTSDAADE